MEKMVAAFAVHVAVAGEDGHFQFVVGDFDPRRRRQRPAVQAVEHADRNIVRQFRRLADAGNQYQLIGVDRPGRQDFPQDFQDGIIAAARAPRWLGIRFRDGNHNFTSAVKYSAVIGNPS
ncbi:hypothetical protein SDC9_127130 [bioreactor metagenome]|uniref:Uncharacterized protein n=1 Tax=bioreactor metagenome TaxID=1076179 RepID=A0A645CT36_9ZZZZ